jgi:glutamate racemase
MLAEQAPQLRFVDGSAGIARRIATLTVGQAWPAAPTDGLALFTRSRDRPPPPLSVLRPFGLGRVQTI